ncbi:hypothetical protein [uncultured Senegalimassilia sp.]|uniref:hypothetical protein n=1 Tax=uncultured Senegalimassilia sp. TaxID=1714350 RepID=UPI0027DB8960|nr:hypothetical protein [uncultured Senegalimassilia sp.]
MDGSTLEAEIASAGVQLAVLASKNVASSVANRFQAIRAKKSIEEACNSYEEIINDLISERSRIIAIAQAYEAELKRYTLGDEDIEYLQSTASAALDVMATFSPNTDLKSLESLKSLISVDTLKAMQLLGFDYKRAIGDPLTDACARAITNGLGGGSKKGSGGSGRQSASGAKRH